MRDDLPPDFIAALCEVVGDLHDNVWAHGRASGFSIAQRWKTAGTDNDYSLEFALTDCGIGFRREMDRVGIPAADDQAAIEWCMQEGHSTKKHGPAPWSQRMPEDIANNPLRGIENVHFSENHHMGLGLFKLTQLVKGFRGALWLATGTGLLTLAPNGQKTYSKTDVPWHGVAIACRFQSSNIRRASRTVETDKDVEAIMRILRGQHGG